MKKVSSLSKAHVRDQADRFLCQDLNERPFVVFTYYSWDRKPLYVGCSKDFIGANNNIADRKPEMVHSAIYVGFVFFESEDEIKAKKKYYIRARNPECNVRKKSSVPLLEGFGEDEDDIVFFLPELEEYWQEQCDKQIAEHLLPPPLSIVDLLIIYDNIMMLQEDLAEQYPDAKTGCLDYSVAKALAATHELQGYLAKRIAVEDKTIEQLLASEGCL